MISVMNQVETLYVAIQGAGDISLPERLEKQIACLEARPDVGVVASVVKSEKDFLKEGNRRKYKVIEYNTVEQMIKQNIINHGEAMIRMSAYRDAGGYRAFFHYVQDYDLWLRILEKYSIVKLNQILYLKRTDAKADISGNPKKSERQALYSLFAVYLANQRLANGKDFLGENAQSLFEDFIKNLSYAEKEIVAKKVFRNVLESQFMIDDAIDIIRKYSHKKSMVRLLKILILMKKTVPSGGDLYFDIYRKINHISYLTRKALYITSSFLTAKSIEQ